MNDMARLKAQMDELAGKFIERTRTEADTIHGLVARLDDAAALEELRYLVHRIHGGGATFGFEVLSEHAGEIEQLIEPAVRNGEKLAPEIWEQIRLASAKLSQAVQAVLVSRS